MGLFPGIIELRLFSFIADEADVIIVLDRVKDADVNIKYFLQIRIRDKYLVKMIVEGKCGRAGDSLAKIIKSVIGKFEESCALRIPADNIPGQIARIQSALIGKVTILSISDDVNGQTILDVDNSEKAKQILG